MSVSLVIAIAIGCDIVAGAATRLLAAFRRRAAVRKRTRSARKGRRL